MLKEILNRGRKKSFTARDMAFILFALTVGTQDAAGQRRLKEEVDEIASRGISSEIAQRELALLKVSAVFVVLDAPDVRSLHGDKVDEVALHYLARFKERVDQGEPAGEDVFLRLSEERLTAYGDALHAWLTAHRNGRGRERTSAIGQTFFRFCEIQETNPVTLLLINVKLSTFIGTVYETLLGCRLT